MNLFNCVKTSYRAFKVYQHQPVIDDLVRFRLIDKMFCDPKDKPYKGQSFKKLRSQSLSKRKLFIDGEFPPTGSSLFFSRPAPADIVWKRPKEIVEDPKFFIDKASADDFSQGSLGNCWFVAACACIAEDSDLWKKVVPDYKSQEFLPESKYAGIFHFKFWRCGSWVDVVIDDYLPTRNGRLIYTHSKSRNEFWTALLEKAYAKLFGCYEALTAGKARDAMVDMTGGVGEGLDVADYPGEEKKDRLFEILRKAKAHMSLMCASIQAKTASEMESKLSVGLVRGHAYSITAVERVPLKGTGLFQLFNREKIHMVRLRNPWGGVEWNGPWSDGSTEWTKVSEKEKKDLGLTFDENGEFWMAFDDFCRYFTHIDVCHMMNTSFFTMQKTWQEQWHLGQWVKQKQTAGGCGNHDSFLKNPQYLVDVYEDEEELLVSLEQEDRRSSNFRTRGENYCIGFTIIKTDVNRKYRMNERQERVHAGPFVQARSVLARIELKKGRYCLIPSTFDPGFDGQYLLRTYSDSKMTVRELLKSFPSPPHLLKKRKVAATAVTIHTAESFPLPDGDAGIEAYCVVKCEGQAIQTSVTTKAAKPEWKERVVFYRIKPEEDIVIELWDANLIKDSFIATLTLPMANAHEYTGGNVIKRYNMVKSNGESDEQRGFLWLQVKHTTDFLSI